MPHTSIVTPLYNAQDTISETIESVLKQTDPHWEMLIVDNNSTDNGPSIVQQYARQDPRIKFLEQHQEKGAGPTRNVAIKAAEGRFIAFLDADDTWHPEKLERQIAFMRKNELAFSWTSYNINTGKTPMPVRKASLTASSRDLLAKRAVIGCLTTIYDTEKLGKVYMTDIPKRQDFVLFVTLLRLAESKGFKTAGLDAILGTYRIQNTSLSSNKASAAKYQWKALIHYCDIKTLDATYLFTSYMIRGILDRFKISRGQSNG